MSFNDMHATFVASLQKKDNKRTESDRVDIAQFLRHAGLYHGALLQTLAPFATVEICKMDHVIYAQHEMVGLQYWYLLQGEVRLYSSKKTRFQFIKTGTTMHTSRESLAELGKYEYAVQEGDFFGVESFVNPDPHGQRLHSAIAAKDGTIILPIQGATPVRNGINFIPCPHQYQVHTLSRWCKIAPELRSDHEVNLILHHLKGFTFFSRMADHLGLSWAKMCVLVNTRAKTLLFRQNDHSDSIYFIISGSCQVRIKKPIEAIKQAKGGDTVNWITLESDFGECVHTFESSESFGELSLDHAKLNEIPRRTASIICAQDCVLLRVDAEAYYTLQKMGQSSRIILSQWTTPLRNAAGTRSSEVVELLSYIMLDFKYFSFTNESARRILAQDLLLFESQPGDIIFLEGEPVFREQTIDAPSDESSLQPKLPDVARGWTTDTVCAILSGSVGAFKKKRSSEVSLDAYLHLNAAQKVEKCSDVFGSLQTTIVAGEGFGEDLLHRKSSEVRRNLSYVCLEPCKLLFYGRETFANIFGPTCNLSAGKSKTIMKKPAEQRTHRDRCIMFTELAQLPFIQNFVEHDFHDFFAKAKFCNLPAFSVISKNFPKQLFGIVVAGAMSVHQSEENEFGKNEVTSVKDMQCHAIRLMFGPCRHVVREGDIFGEFNLKSAFDITKLGLKMLPSSRCTYISRVPTEIIYWDVSDLSQKLLEGSKKGIANPRKQIEIMAKQVSQRTDDDFAVVDEFLRFFGIFDQFPDLSRIVSSPGFDMQQLNASDVIFREGDPVTHLYVLLKGAIQIHSKLKPDPELFSTVAVFGEMSVNQYHSVGSRLMTCTVVETGTCFLRIPFEAFVQLEKLKMVAIFRSAKSFLSEHHCFKMVPSNSALLDELVSGCEILFKSKNDVCYAEGQLLERSVWTVLKGSVELALNVQSEQRNMDEVFLNVKINALGQSTSSSARADMFKAAALRHSLATLRTGASFAPFAVPNSVKKMSKIRADHDAVATENDTIIAVFFLKHSEDEIMTALCLMEQEIAFASEWRQSRKRAGDFAIAHSLSMSTASPKTVAAPHKPSQQYQEVRPKTGLEGKVDANLFLPKLAGSRSVDSIHNDNILDVNDDKFVALTESALEELYVKLLSEREEQARTAHDSSKVCPSPRDLMQPDAGKGPASAAVEVNPDVEKKILNIFAVDKFKRKASAMPETNADALAAAVASASLESKYKLNLNALKEESTTSPESKISLTSSPESQTAEMSAPNRDATVDAFSESKNVASKIAAIMSENKFKYNASEQMIGSSIADVLEAARASEKVEPSWKGKVIEILKTDVFQRTSEDPEHSLQHALAVAAELAQQERDSRLPKEKILIDTFCKRVREKLLVGEAVDSLAFDQLDIYVPDKPVRSFGRNRISDTAKKLFAQDTQTKFGADEKICGGSQMQRPQRTAHALSSLKNRHVMGAAVKAPKQVFSKSDLKHIHSLSVTKISVDSAQAHFTQTKLEKTGSPLARVPTPVFFSRHSLDKDDDDAHSIGEARHTHSRNDTRERPASSDRPSPEIIFSNSHEAAGNHQPSNYFTRREANHHQSYDFSRHSNERSAAGSSLESRHWDDGAADDIVEHGGRKYILFDYLNEVAQSSPDLKKADAASGAILSKSKSPANIGQQQGGSKGSSSKMCAASESDLRLSGQVKATHSVSELGVLHRSQILQVRQSVRSYRGRGRASVVSRCDAWCENIRFGCA